MTKESLLREIKEEVVNLKESPLYNERIKNDVFPVIGEGNHNASIMFIGEAPGTKEAKTGRPFCGTAGRILTEMLEEIKIRRDEVYITNIVKDRPTGNRDPLPEEIEIYAPFLDRQIEIIQPEIIVPLGRFSAKYILEKYDLLKEPFLISKFHGMIHKTEVHSRKIAIIPLQHPAIVAYNPHKREELLEGFKKIVNVSGSL